MNQNNNIPLSKRAVELARNNAVPIMFIIICAIFIPMAGFTPSYLINEIITRMGRNLFLVLCLLFPIMAGMGMNFAMTLGAMGAELAIILVADWQIWGIPGVVLAMILSIPFSAILGLVCGTILNMAKGREIQNECCRIIYKMCAAQGNLYAVIKEILRRTGGPDVGSVRLPLAPLVEGDSAVVDACVEMIREAVAQYC